MPYSLFALAGGRMQNDDGSSFSHSGAKMMQIGLIGAGAMGRAVAKQMIEVDDQLQISSIFDPDPGAIRESRRLFGDVFQDEENLASLVSRDELDWVLISSWNCFHSEQVIAALNAGKNVFCQKPLATNLEDCLAMREAWARSGKQFVIGFTLRFSPHYRRIKEIVASGEIGEIISLEFNETLDFNHGGFIMGDWRRLEANAGSHLLEKCCHDIDLVNWIVGSRASRVASFGGLNFFRPEYEDALERVGRTRSGRQGYMTWRDGGTLNPFKADKDILDNQVAIIEYANGVRASMHLNSNAAMPERRMYICGTLGTLRADVHQGRIEVKEIGFGKPISDHSTSGQGLHGGGDRVLVQEVIATMLRGAPIPASLDEGLDAAVTCFGIDEAEVTGQVIDMSDYWARVDA